MVSAAATNEEAQRKLYYSRLYRKFILITLVCSVVPLLLVGWAINIHYTRFAKNRMINAIETQVDYHRKIIELFLKERSSSLHLISEIHSKAFLREYSNLAHVFEILNQESGSITDLGVIDQDGRHLAYVGPYDLIDKNYSQTEWFKKAMDKGIYISDMFTGFRKVPHFIIAIMRNDNENKWILRATIDTEAFRSLVENVRIGATGEVYLLNEDGIYQTTPRFGGKIMEKGSLPIETFHPGTRIRTQTFSGAGEKRKESKQLLATAWLSEPRWMLVVKQDYDEAFGAVNYANYASLLFLHLCALTILIVSILSARHVVRIVQRRDTEADQLNRQIMETGKMASIGELSAGVAHEINNPLAIILTEKQILQDMATYATNLDEGFRNSLKESLDQMDTQVKRCKRITHNLLRFSRRTRSIIEEVDLNAFLKEVVDLMEREAKSGGIRFILELDPDLKPVLSDPSQLQQVFLNLITNAIDAHDGKPYGTIRVATRADQKGKKGLVTFADTGSGIPKENLNKVFDPFFTTKPVGRGTGLGLSICYGIMQRLGGEIRVQSEVGSGTEFTLEIPFRPPHGLEESIGTEQDI
ncbi:MAG: two-component sensor histidine kinase [Deltaproteobacteria bacterium HGW-Deltaproteobacteria-15]|jgi:two-component system NtrC family sensor kinase|nr:MAG: two-component sensor histidine kinase [Deltaproteobacteria bacterium HGW-Deltaproteobacteria-15]